MVDDFKYLGSYVGSTERDVEFRFGLACTSFAILKSVLRSPNVKFNFKIHIFKAACTVQTMIFFLKQLEAGL